MARNIVWEKYTFDPEAKEIVVNRYIRKENILLITNNSTNTILYNFSDPTKTIEIENNAPEANISNFGLNLDNFYSTTIILNPSVDTTGMTSEDTIQIMVDDKEQFIDFADVMVDGAQKLRVSTPQSLMDTDFEYSVQPSKWEALILANNYPSFFAKPSGGNAMELASVTGDGAAPRSTVTITTVQPHNLSAGQVISVQETLNYLGEGTALITSTPTPYTLTYVARGVISGDFMSGTLTTV